MGKVTRSVTRSVVGEEVLELSDCPSCGGEITVGDCGYSIFNPGYANCGSCGKRWSFADVRDAWDAGQLWNARASEIRSKLDALSYIIDAVHNLGCGVSRDFRDEELRARALAMLGEFETIIKS